ncbi:MAG: SpoIIE family protein phosphatase [Chlorobi bacterium]|nr:SpoIIE family protein phosphatase [Chlorobiota bacterium]
MLVFILALASAVVLHLVLVSVIEWVKEWLPEWLTLVVYVLDSAVAVGIVGGIIWLIARFSGSVRAVPIERFRVWLRWSVAALLVAVAMPSLLPTEPLGPIWRVGGGIVLLIVGGWCALLVFRVLQFYRVARTPLLLRSSMLVSVATLPLAWINALFPSSTIEFVFFFNGVIICVLTILAARRRRWIQVLGRRVRWSIGWWNLLVVILAIPAANAVFDHTTPQSLILHRWLAGIEYVVGYAFLMVGTYAAVVVFAIIGSAGTDERKTYEFDVITFFNRVAADHNEPQRLYDTIVTLSVALSESSGAALYLCSEHRKWELVATAGIDHSRALALDIERIEPGTIQHETVIIPWLKEDERFFSIARSVESYAQSLMVVPLGESNTCYGAIVVVNPHPYAFEHVDAQSLEAFASAVTIALANRRLIEGALERERLQRELMLGREIQRRLLPAVIPAFNGWEFTGWSEPAYEVGGDYFDSFILKDGSRCILVADVSGKGISAAFYMAKLKGICLALAPICSSLAEFVTRIHAALDGVLESRVYITLAAVSIGVNGQINVLRAGHPPPLVATCTGSVSFVSPRGVAIGMVGTRRFSSLIEVQTLRSSDIRALVLYTDGVLEAGLPDGAEFGLTGLRTVLEHVNTLDSPHHIARSIREAMLGVQQSPTLYDDMTVVIMSRIA